MRFTRRFTKNIVKILERRICKQISGVKKKKKDIDIIDTYLINHKLPNRNIKIII